MEVAPGTLQHLWMRFAHHDPEADCEADYDENYLWWERVIPDADGALPVTWVTTRCTAAQAIDLVEAAAQAGH